MEERRFSSYWLGHNLTIVDVVEVLFNEKLFHAGSPQRSDVSYNDVLQSLSIDALWKAAFLVVYERLLIIRNLNWVIAPVLEGESYLRLPDA